VKAWIAVMLVIVATASQAQVTPELRISVKPEVVAVGEPVTIEITVLVPTWFPRPPIYPSFELSNAITRQPPDSSYPTNQRINGETWAGIVREYQVFPMLGATYQLTDQSMTVTYADPQTRKPLKFQVDVPAISFRAMVPAGAEQLDPYLAGRSLELEQQIEGDPDSLQAGDALVVQYTARLDGMPAMFLPPLLELPEIPGLSVYADQPVIDDGPVARRTERLTLVFAAGGQFSLPALELDWWNSVTEQVETATTPALAVSVLGPALSEVQDSLPSGSLTAQTFVLTALALLLGLALYRLAPAARKQWAAMQHRHRASERFAYTQLKSALRSGDAKQSHTALIRWLAKIEPGMGIREFAKLTGDTKLQASIEQLGGSLYSSETIAVDLKIMEQSLQMARRTHLSEVAGQQQTALPRLNP
jgi:hypothetical protein